MIKTKKQMFIVIGAFALVMLLGTVTYAFFNYTRTGSANIIRTGRIAFNSEQGTAINLTDMFPIDTTVNGIMNDSTKVGSVTINVTGDTNYSEGIEYLVSAVGVTNTVGSGQNQKTLPISINVSVANNTENDPATNLGTADESYFTNRGGSSSIYKVLATDTITNNEQLVVGYIAPGATGVDGNIVIKAYLDKTKVAISDTYPEEVVRTVKTTGYSSSNCETALNGIANASTYCASASSLQDAIDNEDLTSAQITLLVNAGLVEEYTNGTPSSFGEGRVVLTTDEWNSLQTNGVSFQIKVESQEGIWVEEIRSVNVMKSLVTSSFLAHIPNIKKVYFNKMGATAMQNAYDNATIKEDLTYNNEGKVLAWLETNQTDNTKYNLIIASDGDTYLETGHATFVNWYNVDTIEFNNVDTSRVTTMQSMFEGATNLTTIKGLNNFDTRNVTSFNNMFTGTKVTELDLSSFDTSGLTDNIAFMFNNCSLLETIYVSLDKWNVSSQPEGMPIFGGCSSLVGQAPNTTYAFDSSKIDKNMAVIATDTTEGYLTDISLKPAS